MTFEVEVKIKAYNLEVLEDLLIEKGATIIDITVIKDHYFNHPSRDFQETDEAFRIREEGDLVYLTYKGPKLDDKSKTRLEEQVEVKDFEVTKNIVTHLGFKKVLTVIKDRRTYQMRGFTICMDTVDSLGTFVEIEKEIDNLDDMVKTRDEIYKLAKEILLKPHENGIRKSYLELLLEKKNE
ncbi:MAG: class IV adenylate cyclase [Candidatus Heimdallarchaeota archaeon]